MTHSPQLLNATETAKRLGVPVVTLRYWLRHGRSPVPPVDGMKPPKWKTVEVEAFLQARTVDVSA